MEHCRQWHHSNRSAFFRLIQQLLHTEPPIAAIRYARASRRVAECKLLCLLEVNFHLHLFTFHYSMFILIFHGPPSLPAAAILFCALASLLPSHLSRSSLLAATSKSSSSSLHVSESPIPVITTEINKANHELGQAAAKQVTLRSINAKL